MSWERADGRLALRVVVPVGAAATVHVPGRAEPVRVGHGTHEWQVRRPGGREPALPAQATVRDVLDHEHDLAAVVAAAVETGVVSGERRPRPARALPRRAGEDWSTPWRRAGLIEAGLDLHAQLDGILRCHRRTANGRSHAARHRLGPSLRS